VAVDGDTVVVGAHGDEDPNGSDAGSAYVFEKGTGWADGHANQSAKLDPDDGDDIDQFGWSVAMHGDTVVVGAHYDEDPNGNVAGSAYVFEKGTGWGNGHTNQVAKLDPDDGDSDDYFGISVAVGGDTVVVGAHGDEDPNGSYAGSAYVFEKGTGWADGHANQSAKLAPCDGDSDDYFGISVAVDSDTMVVGAHGDEDPNGHPIAGGSTYTFDLCDTASASSGAWSSTSTWDGGAVPTSADGVCVLNGHTVTLGAGGQSRFVYVEPGGTLDLSTYSLGAEESVCNCGIMQQTQNVSASSTANFLQIQPSGGGADRYRGLDIATDVSNDLGVTTVRVMGNTDVCNNPATDGGAYRNRCLKVDPANSGSATVTLHSTVVEDDISDDAFFQWASGTTWMEMTACNDAVGGGGTCTEASVTFSSPEYFLIGSQASDPTTVTLQAFAAEQPQWLPVVGGIIATLSAAAVGVAAAKWRRRTHPGKHQGL
jgi:hypothetical protein